MVHPLVRSERTIKNRCFSCIRNNVFSIAIIVGVLLGGAVGALLKYLCKPLTPRQLMYIEYPGQIFMRMLKSLVIPLISSSLISAISNLDLSLSKKIAFRAITYYLTTVFAAVCLGIFVVVTIRPGAFQVEKNSSLEQTNFFKKNMTFVDAFLDLVKNMFPPNIIQACLQKEKTVLVPPKDNKTKDLLEWGFSEKIVPEINNIGLVVISLITGIALAHLKEKTKTLKEFFDNVMTISIKITKWLIFLSPFGIFFLVTAQILKITNISKVLIQLSMYVVTVLVGLCIQGIIILPLLFFLLTKRNPWRFLLNLGAGLLTTFGTSSSVVSFPITVNSLEKRCGVDPRIARFCLPIGASINMDGTALYEAIAAIFIAQVRNVEMDIGKYVAVSITATAASIGAAGIPEGGLITMVMVLDSVGLPADDISMILAVDWLLDRVRTTVNAIGDSLGVGIVYYRSLKELDAMPE